MKNINQTKEDCNLNELCPECEAKLEGNKLGKLAFSIARLNNSIGYKKAKEEAEQIFLEMIDRKKIWVCQKKYNSKKFKEEVNKILEELKSKINSSKEKKDDK